MLGVNRNKVKKLIQDRYKNKGVTLVFVLTIATICLLIGVKFLIERDENTSVLESLKESFSSAPVTKYEPVSPEAPVLKFGPKTKARLMLDARGIDPTIINHRAEQERLIRAFKEKIHLSIDLPPGMEFIELDLSESVAGLSGTSLDGKQKFVVLATKGVVDLQTVQAYLAEEKGAFPLLRNHELQPDKIIKFTPPSSTGLSELSIIPATENKDSDLYAVLAPRKDEAGSYLFIMEAPGRHFEDNEDGFEKMLNTIKAKP